MQAMCLSTFRSRCSLTAIVISSLSALSFSNAAFAQAPEDETVAVQSDVANAADDQSTGDAIVVTGSRIPRVGFDTLEPATTISSQLVESRGQTNIVDTLTATPSFGLGQTPQGQQGSFNAGQSFADRFGLGSARTLTLFNGRRVVSTNAPSVSGTRVGTPAPPGLQVDLNIIPTLLVERVENLSIGGAPAYGSDAISGVVNVILKSKYSGLTVSALSGITEQGDNFRLNVAGLAGTDFAEGRGNVMFAASYDRSEGVLGSARKRIRQAYDFDDNPSVGSVISNTPGGRTTANDGRINSSIPFNSGNADGVPASVLIRNFRAEGLTTGGVILPVGQFIRADGTAAGFGVNGTTRLQFDPSGNLIPYNPAIPFSGFFGSGGDGFNLSETTQILSDVKRISLNLNASFELTPNIEVFAESMYFNGKGRELVDQPTYATPLVGSRTNPQGPLLVSVSDPRLTDQARTLLTSLGVSTFNVSKAYLGFIDGRSMSSNDVYRAVGGIRGKFGSFGREFTYEVSANYGRTEGNYLRNQIIQQNFVNALNVRRDASGAIVCDANPAFNVASGTLAPVLDAACVPLNPFGTDGVSKAAANYVTARTLSRSLLEQTVFSANISTGSLIDLWSGPVGFSIGAETRREHGRFTPDPLELAGRTQNPAIAAADGSFRTKEVFGELEIPLISEDNNIPLVHALSVEGRARYVDNSINGGFTTYTLGGRYQPVRDITFRGNFTRALRAPAIVELFTPNAVGVSSFPDPCDSANVASGPNPSIRARNCAAFYSEYGLNPANFVSQAKSVGQATLDGGNINLQNETSNAYTFGFVLRPSFMPRMTMAVDWNRIKIKGPIAQLTTADIASGCYDNPDFDLNNPDAGNQFCSLFSRDATGQLVNDRSNPGIRRTFVNGGSIDFRGLTANVNYAGLPLDGVGLADTTLSLDGSFFYLDRLCRSINAVTTTCAQGTITNPRYSGQLSATLAKGPFSLFTEVNYQSGGKYDLTFTNETQDILKVDSLITVNAAIGYGINDDWSMRFTVTNLFDTPPPFPLTTGDLLGRRFVVRVTKTF